MRKEIITKYGIDFQNENNGGIIDKIPGSNLKYITHLLYDWRAEDIDDPDHGLLTDIDTALSDPCSEVQAGSEMVDLLIYQDRVEFEYRGGGDYTMPTLDLREIVIAWRDFLLAPPLNGTKVWSSRISICRLAMAKLKKIFDKKY